MYDRLPPAPLIGAIIYSPSNPPEKLQQDFAVALAERGFRLGGVLQETETGDDGCKCSMEVVELDTKRRLSISQALGMGSQSCSLDPAALAEASLAVRRAQDAGVDLVMVNKFSKAEKSGRGLAAEMLGCMAAGVPVLTALPGVMMDDWLAFTGGRGQILMPDSAALWRWWGPENLYRDLINGVGVGDAEQVLIGLNWVMVRGPHGVGLAQTPDRGAPACVSVTRGWGGRPLKDLAELVLSVDPLEAAVGMAAINAWYNRFDLTGPDVNGLDSVSEAAFPVVIGAFPGLAERLPKAMVVDRRPGPGQYPEEAAQWLLPRADGVVITASTLANRSLPALLRRCENAAPTLVGPGATLSNRLHVYGVGAMSGLIAQDVDGLARAVMEGGGAKDLKKYCRQVTLGAAG